MRGQTVILRTKADRSRAQALVFAAPERAVVNIREESRSSEQNAKLWAMLSEISRAKPEGRNLPPDVWKCIFMHACGHQCQFQPSLDGNGVVPLGFKSSRLTKAEFSDLIECIQAFAAQHEIELTEP